MADHFIGLISGTSMDGIDAVCVRFDPACQVVAQINCPYPASLVRALDTLRTSPDRFPVAAMARLDAELGDAFAAAARAVMDQAGMAPEAITAVGSHGQTVLHRAGPDDHPAHTLQIGDPHRIAAATGVVTVADFRRADLAAGGQGAPLAPLIHQALLANSSEYRVVVNLGGIANLTRLHPARAVSGFDTGPANCFLDAWYRRHQQGRFDRNGDWAASGNVDSSWLQHLLADPYFSLPPPKSTGIEYFSLDWLDRRLPDWAATRPQDIQATLAEFSAASLAEALSDDDARPDRVLVCGGGVHNHDLLERIRRRLSCPVQSTSDFGLDPEFVEATLFAWLARERLAGRPVATPGITGARGPVLLGVVCQPPQ